jgi:hypothetical protein
MSLSALQGEFQAEASGLLQVGDHLEEISRLGIPFWAKHAHETLRGFVGEVAQRFKAYGRVDVIAQNGLAGLELSGEETFNALAQKLVPESRIAFDAGLYGSLKIAR